MTEDVVAAAAKPDGHAQMDEQRLAKALAIGLPLVTISVAAVVGVLIGPATAILALAAGLLLGVIALFWGSLRVLSGDAALSPELEALDMAAQGTSTLASRKKMLLRALKDLESERAIGKIEDDDYEQLAGTYRAELKLMLKRIDDSLAPHRAKAEEAARAHLLKAGLAEIGYRGEQPGEGETKAERTPTAKRSKTETATKSAGATRLECPSCGESNEPDAKFCKECATKLRPASTASKELVAAASESDSEEEKDV